MFPAFGEWVQLLKEIAPQVGRVAYLFQSDNSTASNYAIGDLEAAARLLNIEVTAAPCATAPELRPRFAALSAERRSGAIVLPGPYVAIHRQEIFAAANRHGVPVIYPFRFYANDGGLIAYGVDENDLHWRSASYIDRILKGASPGDLPVQAPTKFELVVNAKAAKVIGIEVPQSILLRADEVIE